jgi:3D (Asp-Asp-Asp) domain-containing protein
MVAADRALMPFGTLVSVPGYHGGMPVPVLDRGGAIKGERLDVLLPTHAQALAWGKRTVEVTVWRYAQP